MRQWFLISTGLVGQFLLLWTFHSHASETVTFSSGPYQTTMVELYTSEGCSSCPRADRWLSKLEREKKLWSEVIPMAFHVDYWDYLGWSDKLAQHDFTLRQQKYKQQGHIRSVYTPGFVVNGAEWRGFFGVDRTLPVSGAQPGKMQLEADRQQMRISFDSAGDTALDYHIAVLGSGFEHQIQAGENHGKKLQHDFAVLATAKSHSDSGFAAITAPLITQRGASRYAVVAWVSQPGSVQPLQAVGGWLPTEQVKTAF